MRKMFLMAMMALVMCGLAACSSSDDDGGQPAKKSDPALIGDWVEWTDESHKEIRQAISFQSRDDMLMYMQRVSDALTGGWYHAEYTITGDGTMTLDATPIHIVEFNRFDDCEWFAVDPVHLTINFGYRISGDELHIVELYSGKEVVLKKFASSSNWQGAKGSGTYAP